ncbi:ABC transporter, substrate-binding protein, aliphatic sulfonate [Sesbania bispinosa]|nr:ABC transporter, substrate-binding protein, aliphatic sulfonate [Sesbania bispinosa]
MFSSMDAMSCSSSSHVLRFFVAIICLNEEKIRVNDEFYANWSQYLSDGIVVLKDPKGKCNSVHLGGHHHIQFLYNNCREFLIKIRSESMSEISYPDFLSPLFVNQSEANYYYEEVFPSRCWNVRLTDAIVSGEKLMPIPVLFCDNILTKNQERISLIDERGMRRSCPLKNV